MPAGVIADKVGRKMVILAGFILFSLIYFGFAVFATAVAVWGLFAFYGLFMGITEGVQKAFLSTIIPSELKATAFGIYNMSVGLGHLPASLIAGLLWDKVSLSAPFYFGSATALLSALFFVAYIVVTEKKRR